jgi:hypothetical protein
MRLCRRRPGLDVELTDYLLQKNAEHILNLRPANYLGRADGGPIGTQNVDTHRTGLHLLASKIGLDAHDLGPHLRIVARYLIGDRNGNEVPVEKSDYLDVGERTRSQPEGPASTAARVYIPVVGKQENRTILLFRKFLGSEDVGGPPNQVEFLLVARWLEFVNLLLDL